MKPTRRYGSARMETLELHRSGDGIVTLTLNRPEKKNAVDRRMWSELIEAFDEVADNDDDRVLVITGAGDGFCSGADLTDAALAGNLQGGVGSALRQMRIVGRAALRLHELPKPTIAKVNGVAAGAGCNLALGCDLVIASDRARFTEIFATRGLSIDFGGSWLLPRLVGLHKAKELVFLAEIIGAEEAEKVGIVNRVVPADDLDKVVDEIAHRIAAQAPLQLSISKRLLNQSMSVSMADALEFEDVAQTMNFGSRDTAEAMQAFIEKRAPEFKGE